MPLSGGTSTASSSSSSSLGPGEAFVPFPNNYPNPYTVNGRMYLKTGTTALASAYPSVPAAAQITFGADPTKHTLWPTGQNPLGGSSYTATQAFLKNDGSSNMFAISGDGEYCGYSANGGTSWTSGATGIAATTVNDVLWYASGNLWIIFTSAGIYTIPLNSRTATLQQSGTFISGAANGATIVAVQNANTNIFYTSTNGTTWTTFAAGIGSIDVSCIRYLNGGWVLVSNNSSMSSTNTIYVSSNGTSWTAGNPTTIPINGVSDIAYASGYYLFISGRSSGYGYACFCASLTSGAGATSILSLGTGSANLGSIAWNGSYFAVGINYTSSGYYAFAAFLPNSNSVTYGYIIPTGSTQQNPGNGSICAFSSGAYAGQFFQGANYNQGSNLIYNTLVGTYINAGLNLTSNISNMNFYMRVA